MLEPGQIELDDLRRRLDELTGALGRFGERSLGHNREHGTDSHVPRDNFSATAAPGVTNDSAQGYGPGSSWVDITNDKEYVCLDGTAGAAVWTETTLSHTQSHNHSAAGDGTTLTPAILNVPYAAAPTPTAEGQMYWDSDDDKLIIGNGVGQLSFISTGAVSGDGTMTVAGALTIVAATQANSGKVELATTAEINTGIDTTRAMPVDQYVASNRNVRYIVWRVLASGTSHTVSTTVGGDFESPIAGTITGIGAYVDTAGVTSLATIDANKNGLTLMAATKITIDSSEKTSRTAATAPVLSTTSLAVGDILTIDIDAIQTTAAKGLTVWLAVRLT